MWRPIHIDIKSEMFPAVLKVRITQATSPFLDVFNRTAVVELQYFYQKK